MIEFGKKILSVRIYLTDGTFMETAYDPPLDYTTFREAFDEKFFIYRIDYPSYKRLGFIPV